MSIRNRILVVVMLFMGLQVQAAEKASEARLDEVAERGTQVMPFDLEQTTHVFTKNDNGGLQQVVVKDNSNVEQIRLIREHLIDIAGKFAQGDYGDPASIHGEDMPGLAALRQAKPGTIDIVYTELENGGQIVYSTKDPQLVQAIHQWFEAQLSDHSRHAVDHSMHHQHHSNP
jgi:hypothetical protein